jgi:hypothetical protein
MVIGVGFVILLLVVVIIAVDRGNKKKSLNSDDKQTEGKNT